MRLKYIITFILFIWIVLCYSSTFSQRAKVVQYHEAVFPNVSNIHKEKADPKLLDRIIELIDATPKGEEITICIFKFSYKKITEALQRAKHRGVAVRIILNKGDTSDEDNEKNKERLKEIFDDFYFIENDVSKKGIIHNKFILFTRTLINGAFEDHVILQTSTNFQKKSTEKLQDMIIFSDKSIYDGYMRYWSDILSYSTTKTLSEYNYFNVVNESKTIKAFFYPKRKNGKKHGKDDIKQVLKNIQDPENAVIKFAHGKWDNERLDIVEELEELQEKGASLKIISNRDIDQSARDELKEFGKHVVFLNKTANLHTKFLLIQDGDSKLVITGSHNITKRSLRENFEVLIVFDNELLYEAYDNFFNEILDIF